METPTDPANGRILALDGWRGISVLMVVGGHLISERFGITRFASNDVGVLIFFAISGFIITKLAIGEHAKYGNFSISRFYARRGLRILPPFLLYLTCVLVASAAGLVDQTYLGVLKASTFLCISSDVIPSIPCQWFVAHTSSLGYEELFYIAFPLIFSTFARVPRSTFVAVLLGLVTFLELRKALHLTEAKVITTTAGYFVFICMGALAATFEPVLARFAKTRLGIALWFVSALIIAARIAFVSIGATPDSIIGQLESASSLVLGAIPFATSWLVVGSIYSGSRLFAFLEWGPLVWVGEISYSLYLWQQIFTAPPELYTATGPFLIAPLMFVAAAASYYWIELPCRRISKRLKPAPGRNADSFVAASSAHLPP
jgi:peptidoglycan/LPS O-acetylase OafA/YrhL